MRFTITPAGSRYALAGSPNATVQITDALSATVETATQADALDLARARWPLAASWACYPHNAR